MSFINSLGIAFVWFMVLVSAAMIRQSSIGMLLAVAGLKRSGGEYVRDSIGGSVFKIIIEIATIASVLYLVSYPLEWAVGIVRSNYGL